MGKNVDLKQLDDYIKRLQNANKSIRALEVIANEISKRILRSVKKNTPVDKGRLRKGWDVEIKRTSDGYDVIVSNNVEYAPYVEYGHRSKGGTGWVNGHFMLTKAESEIADKLPSIVEKKLKQCMEGWGL